MLFEPGAIYSCKYVRWHVDRNPLAFVIYSDSRYTHCLNLHYVPPDSYDRIVNMFAKMRDDKRIKNKFFINPRSWYYDFFKRYFDDFLEVSYRTYFTGLLTGTRVNHLLRTHEIGSRWREPRTGSKAQVYDKLRARSKRDKKLKELTAKLKYQGFTKSTIKLSRKEWKRYSKRNR